MQYGLRARWNTLNYTIKTRSLRCISRICLVRYLAIYLVTNWSAVACAEPSPEKQISDGLSQLGDQLFEGLLGDADAERQALEKVEISLKEERELGEVQLRQFLESLRAQRTVVEKRGKDVTYVSELLKEIRPLMQHAARYESISVYVAVVDGTDARSFPGGSIVCTRGMIEFAKSEAALVGVLAHELSHIDRGHQLDKLRRFKLAQDTFTSSNRSFAEWMTSGTAFVKMFAKPFQPSQEAEADLDAANWMFQAGYDPGEMAELFHRLHQRDPEQVVPLPGFLRSHPYHAERYEVVKQFAIRMQAAGNGDKLYVGRKNLRLRIPRSAKRFAE